MNYLTREELKVFMSKLRRNLKDKELLKCLDFILSRLYIVYNSESHCIDRVNFKISYFQKKCNISNREKALKTIKNVISFLESATIHQEWENGEYVDFRDSAIIEGVCYTYSYKGEIKNIRISFAKLEKEDMKGQINFRSPVHLLI